MPKILVAAYGGGHARLLIPVIRDLEARGHEVTVLGLTLGKAVFNQANITAVGLYDILQYSPRWCELERLGKSVLKELDIHPQIGWNDSLAYIGSGLLDLIETQGEAAAMDQYVTLGRKAFDQSITANEILLATECDVLVTTSAPRMERALVRASTTLNVRSVVVVDLFASIEKSWLTAPTFANCICVFHELVKQILVEGGRPARDIVVTGNPAFDAISAIPDKRFVRDKPHVLFLSVPDSLIGDKYESVNSDRVVHVLGEGVSKGHFTAEIRFHPNEREAIREQVRGKLLDRSMSHSLEDTLADADIVVTECSTAGIQAQLLGLPVVKLGWSSRSTLVPLEKLAPTWIAQSEEQLLVQIELASAAGRFPRIDGLGMATSRVVNQIERIARD